MKNLLPSQANQVLAEIQAAQLDPSEFKWEMTASLNFGEKVQVGKLVHVPSNYYFIFDVYGGSFLSSFSPGEQTITVRENHKSWASQLERAREWLSYLRREISSPNLWEALSQESGLMKASTTEEANTPFTSTEKKYILSGLEEVKQYLLKAHRLDPELVESRLNYLVEATSSSRLGRKDWKNILFSVLIGLVIETALPPDSARDLFRFVYTVFAEILKQRPLMLT